MSENEQILKDIIDNLDYLEKVSYGVIVVIVLNLGVSIVKFIFERNLKDRDKHIHRKNLITERCIKTQEAMFMKLDELTLFTGEESQQLLEKIQEIRKFRTHHALFIDKKLGKIIDSILDYFLSVCGDYRKKDVGKEFELLEKYATCFNK